MPELNSPKKRVQHDSIDGMIPSRRPNINAHQYYKSGTARSTGPRRPLSKQPNHRAQLHADNGEITPENEKTVPLIGDFSAKEQNIFDGGYVPEPKKKQKKEKKGPGRLRRWWKNRSRKFKVLFIAFLICLGLAGLLGARLYSFLNSVFSRSVGNSSSSALEETDDPTKLNTEGDGRFNLLLLGRGGAENEAPDLTDTMLIASIDIQNQTVSLLSIPRDTWVRVKGENMKINAAYSTGKIIALDNGKSKDAAEDEGVKTAIGAVRDVAGVPIHKYVLSDYKAFRDVVNALGGVDVTVNEAIYDRFTGWKFKAGPQTMNGDRALQFARTRQGSARGDFDRNENQRKLLVAMRKKATSTGIVANPVRLNSLANAVQKNIRTDLSIDEAKTLFEKTKTLPDSSIKSLDLAKPVDPLVTTGNIGGQSVVLPTAGAGDFSEIRAYARTNMLDPYLRKEAPTVAVYNASGKAGFATTVGDVLAGYGYKVLAKETSETNQPKTVVIKMTKTAKPFTDRFLSVRFKSVISDKLPSGVVPPAQTPTTTSSSDSSSSTPTPAGPDYIIILGTDWRAQTGPTW